MTDRVTFASLELRVADPEGDGRTIEGIAVPYGEVTHLTPHGAERFLAGSMTKTVSDWRAAKRPLKVFRAHDHSRAVGHVTTLEDGPEALRVSIRLADTPAGRDTASEVSAGLLDSMSIGFRAVRERMSARVREVLEAALLEVSLVPLPAYSGAAVESVRAADAPTYPTVPPMPTIPPHLLRGQ